MDGTKWVTIEVDEKQVPIYKAAPDLYEALKGIERNCFKDKRGAYWIGRVDMANAEQAIAKGENNG